MQAKEEEEVVVVVVVVVGASPPPRDYIFLKMDHNGKGVRGGGSSVLRKLIREATTRGMCVLESIGIITLGFSANDPRKKFFDL